MKTAVTWPPLNRPVTSTLRALMPPRIREHPFLARYLPRAGVVEAPLPHGDVLRMWSLGDDEVASMVFWRGWAAHERETITQFYDLAVSARITIDVGAHVGYFALVASLANPGGRVYAFEPLATVRDRMLRNIALNALDNVSCFPHAVGEMAGTADFFHVKEGIPSSSSFNRGFMESNVKGELTISQVEVTTIDEFAEFHGLHGIDLVKVDTEATEDQVLRGMTATLERDRPAIICEVLPDGPGEAIERILSPLGYQFFLFTDTGRTPTEHIRPHLKWRNFLFLAEPPG